MFTVSRGVGRAGEEDTVCLVDQSRRYAASAAERWPAAQLPEGKIPPGFVRYVELEGTQHAFCLPNYTASPKTVRRPPNPRLIGPDHRWHHHTIA